MFHFLSFKGFLTTGREEFYCPFSINRVIKGKIVHFVNKMSNFAQTIFDISRCGFNLELI